MATLTRGITFGASETVTNTKLHNLVDLGAVSQIVDADCSPSMALSDTKLADITTGNKVRGTALGNLSSIPSGAGAIPTANLPILGSSFVSLTSIPNLSLLPLTLTSWVDGAAMRNIQSIPSLAGQFPWYSIISSLASGGIPQFNGSSFVGASIARNIDFWKASTAGSLCTIAYSNATYTDISPAFSTSPLARSGQIYAGFTITAFNGPASVAGAYLTINGVRAMATVAGSGTVNVSSILNVDIGDTIGCAGAGTNNFRISGFWIKVLNPDNIQIFG